MMIVSAMRWTLGAWLLAALCACGSEQEASRRPTRNELASATVLLVTLDTTRADRLGCYGYAPASTPTVDALAARGLLFERCWSVAPLTLPSHASILSGAYPCAHGVHDNGIFVLGAESELVSEVLDASGWHTGAFVGAFVLDPRFGLNQGFDAYRGPGGNDRASRRISDRPAGQVVDEALAWLARVPSGEPLFLWVHLFDPHMPYTPPEPYASRAKTPYDAELAYADAELGRLLAALDRARKGPRLTIVTADHGESFLQHAEPTHGIFVYDSTMRVPLIVVGDGVPHGRVDRAVSLVDVPATILDWLDLSVASIPASGRSLLDTGTSADRALYMECLYPHYAFGWHPLRGLVWQDWKYVDTRRPELYDLKKDSGEEHDLVGQQKERAAAFQQRLQSLVADNAPQAERAPGQLDPDARARLAALGYVAGGAGIPADRDQPDPKDVVHRVRESERAMLLLQAARQLSGLDGAVPASAPPDPAERRRRAEAYFDESEGLLRKLVEQAPELPEYSLNLALLLLSRGRHQEAIPLFEHMAELGPDPAPTRANLAACYEGIGRLDWARQEMQKAVTLDARMDPAYEWLVRYHLARSEIGRAAFWRREQQRTFVGPAEGVRWLQQESERLSAAAATRGQAVEAPPDFPAREFAPAGRAQGR